MGIIPFRASMNSHEVNAFAGNLVRHDYDSHEASDSGASGRSNGHPIEVTTTVEFMDWRHVRHLHHSEVD